VVHHRQGLAFGLEAGNDLVAVHAGLDDLERDLAADRLELLGHIDHAHAPLADLLEQLVRANDCAGLFRERRCIDRGRRLGQRTLKKTAGLVVRLQQRLDFATQLVVCPTGLVEVRRAMFWV